MRIIFLQDFGGVETNEIHYLQGETVEIPDGIAAVLIREHRAMAAPEVSEVPEVSEIVTEPSADVESVDESITPQSEAVALDIEAEVQPKANKRNRPASAKEKT